VVYSGLVGDILGCVSRVVAIGDTYSRAFLPLGHIAYQSGPATKLRELFR